MELENIELKLTLGYIIVHDRFNEPIHLGEEELDQLLSTADRDGYVSPSDDILLPAEVGSAPYRVHHVEYEGSINKGNADSREQIKLEVRLNFDWDEFIALPNKREFYLDLSGKTRHF